MRIYISEDLTSCLNKLPKKYIELFVKKIADIEKMNITQISSSEEFINLFNKQSIKYYAYNLKASKYIVFAYTQKKSIVVLDIIDLIDKNQITSLVYSDQTTDNENTDNLKI